MINFMNFNKVSAEIAAQYIAERVTIERGGIDVDPITATIHAKTITLTTQDIMHGRENAHYPLSDDHKIYDCIRQNFGVYNARHAQLIAVELQKLLQAKFIEVNVYPFPDDMLDFIRLHSNEVVGQWLAGKFEGPRAADVGGSWCIDCFDSRQYRYQIDKIILSINTCRVHKSGVYPELQYHLPKDMRHRAIHIGYHVHVALDAD